MFNHFLLFFLVNAVSEIPHIFRGDDKIIFYCIPLKILNINS